MSQIREQVLEIMLDTVPDLDPENMADDANYREVFNVDSMDFLAILEQVEDTFGVTVPEDDYEQVQTLGGLTAYIEASG